jgi:hypothetical protein
MATSDCCDVDRPTSSQSTGKSGASVSRQVHNASANYEVKPGIQAVDIPCVKSKPGAAKLRVWKKSVQEAEQMKADDDDERNACKPKNDIANHVCLRVCLSKRNEGEIRPNQPKPAYAC